MEEFRATSRKRVEFVVKSKRLNLDPEAGVDAEAFLKEYRKVQRRPLQDDFFDTEINGCVRLFSPADFYAAREQWA